MKSCDKSMREGYLCSSSYVHFIGEAMRQERSSLADRPKSRVVFQLTNQISARQVPLVPSRLSHEGRDRVSPTCS